MDKLNNNDATLLAIEHTYEIDYEAEDVFERGANYLDELANSNFFLDAINNYIKNNPTDFSVDVENSEDIFAFIKKAYEKSGIKGDKKSSAFSYNPSSLKSWIKGERIPSKTETQRIALCLGMNVLEATEFILKASLVKPFNFKEIEDSVCYFCLNTGATFTEAQEITKKVNSANITPEPYPENDTIRIGEQVKAIKTEEELIRYLAANKQGFENQNRTALSTLRDLVKKSVPLAEWERKQADDTDIAEIKTENDVPAILNVILGYEARAKIDGVEVYKKKISDSNFPDLIKNNFPQPQQLQEILTGKKTSPSSEAIRKVIILFTFYNIFAKLKKDNKLWCVNAFDLYSDTIDETLYRCGYIQMYWKHPYDWMFGYCAGATDPLEELRALIGAFYLDLEDVYSEGSRFDKE